MTDQLVPLATIYNDLDDVKMTLAYDATERKIYALDEFGFELNSLAEGWEFADQGEAIDSIQEVYARGWDLEWVD